MYYKQWSKYKSDVPFCSQYGAEVVGLSALKKPLPCRHLHIEDQNYIGPWGYCKTLAPWNDSTLCISDCLIELDHRDAFYSPTNKSRSTAATMQRVFTAGLVWGSEPSGTQLAMYVLTTGNVRITTEVTSVHNIHGCTYVNRISCFHWYVNWPQCVDIWLQVSHITQKLA